MKTNYLKAKWKMWEGILVITGWLFGYGHEAYFGVKHNRNMAYCEYIFSKDRKK